MNTCNTCNDLLVTGENWTPSMERSRWYLCAPCRGKHRRAEYKKDNRRNRDQEMRSRYGVGLDWYNEQLEKQDYSCDICGKRDSGSKRTDHFCIDHDHDTGKARALLCHQCNTGLGRFSDDINLLYSAIEYLEKHGKKR